MRTCADVDAAEEEFDDGVETMGGDEIDLTVSRSFLPV